MITIRRFSNVAEAGFARSVLEAVGIDAALADENAFTLGPQYVPWGIRLQVPEPDAERAQRVLDQQEGFAPLPDDFVPPPAVPEEATPSGPRGWSIPQAFIWGGLSTVVIFSVLVVISLAVGGVAHVEFGGLLLLFALGGVIGIIVRAIYNKGTRGASVHN